MSGTVAAGMRRWVCCLTEYDEACVAHIMEANGLTRKAEAVRFALLHQKDRSEPDAAGGRYADVAASVYESTEGKGGTGRPKLSRWHQLYNEDQMAIIELIRRRHGIRAKASAVRFALRVQARQDGFRAPLPKATPQPVRPRQDGPDGVEQGSPANGRKGAPKRGR